MATMNNKRNARNFLGGKQLTGEKYTKFIVINNNNNKQNNGFCCNQISIVWIFLAVTNIYYKTAVIGKIWYHSLVVHQQPKIN